MGCIGHPESRTTQSLVLSRRRRGYHEAKAREHSEDDRFDTSLEKAKRTIVLGDLCLPFNDQRPLFSIVADRLVRPVCASFGTSGGESRGSDQTAEETAQIRGALLQHIEQSRSSSYADGILTLNAGQSSICQHFPSIKAPSNCTTTTSASLNQEAAGVLALKLSLDLYEDHNSTSDLLWLFSTREASTESPKQCELGPLVYGCNVTLTASSCKCHKRYLPRIRRCQNLRVDVHSWL